MINRVLRHKNIVSLNFPQKFDQNIINKKVSKSKYDNYLL